MNARRAPLGAAALIAAALALQGLLLALWSTTVGSVVFGVTVTEIPVAGLFWSLLTGVLHYAAFGVGVSLSLRFVSPIVATSSWRQTVGRAVVATVAGALVALALALLVSLIAGVTIGSYPLGYSLDAALDGARLQYGIQNAFAGALTPLIGWMPMTVLGCVLLRLWLVAHPASTPPKDRASVSA